MTAVGGTSKACIGPRLLLTRNSLPNVGPVVRRALGAGSTVFAAAGVRGASGAAANRTSAFGAAGAELAGAAELEAGVAAEGAARRPSSSSTRAKTDWPKNANSKAATATLTRVSLFFT